MNNKINCSGCKREMNIVYNQYNVIDIMKSESLFSGDRCKDCFEKDFDKMSFEEQIPKFGKNLLS
jgi:hypothetical protein